MATKKSASKKTAGTEAPAAKPAAKKAAAKKTVDVQASAPAEAAKTPAKAAKAHPSQHDISVQAYLLWERDGKKHGHQEHYWKQAEQELTR